MLFSPFSSRKRTEYRDREQPPPFVSQLKNAVLLPKCHPSLKLLAVKKGLNFLTSPSIKQISSFLLSEHESLGFHPSLLHSSLWVLLSFLSLIKSSQIAVPSNEFEIPLVLKEFLPRGKQSSRLKMSSCNKTFCHSDKYVELYPIHLDPTGLHLICFVFHLLP